MDMIINHCILHRYYQVRLCLLGKANLCTNGLAQVQCLCLVNQNEMLATYHSPTLFFFTFLISSATLFQLKPLSQFQKCPVPVQFPLLEVVITVNTIPNYWAFYFQGSDLPMYRSCCSEAS